MVIENYQVNFTRLPRLSLSLRSRTRYLLIGVQPIYRHPQLCTGGVRSHG